MKHLIFALISSGLFVGNSLDARVSRYKRNTGGVKEITSMEEYDQVCASKRPTVIVFNSPTCEACTKMKPGLEAAAEAYPGADFYTLNAKSDGFKDIKEKAKLTGYPTTHFRKPNAETRIERGSMGAEELDGIVYQHINGKRKPQPLAKKSEEAPSKK